MKKQDQRSHMLGERWTTASTVGSGPLACDQLAVPPQDRAWRHQKDRPPVTGKGVTEDCEEGTIGGTELGSLDLAAQHVELVA